jgi:hypothetical protein
MNKDKTGLYCAGIFILFGLLLAVIFLISNCVGNFRIGQGQYVKLGENDKVKFFALNQGEQSIYYFNPGSKNIKQYSIKNKTSEDLYQISLENINDLQFSPNFDYLTIQTFDPYKGTGESWLADLRNKEKIKLAGELGKISWSSKGTKIAYQLFNWNAASDQIIIYSVPEKKIIKSYDIGGTNFNGTTIGWISEDEIYYFPIPSEKESVPLLKIDLRTSKESLISKAIFEALIYQNKFLINALNNQQALEIKTMDLTGQTGQTISNKQTNFKKVAVFDDNLFLTETTENGDNGYLINLATKEIKEILKSEKKNKFNILNPQVDPANKIIYFLNGDYLYCLRYE